jgi:hypothetical protein
MQNRVFDGLQYNIIGERHQNIPINAEIRKNTPENRDESRRNAVV